MWNFEKIPELSLVISIRREPPLNTLEYIFVPICTIIVPKNRLPSYMRYLNLFQNWAMRLFIVLLLVSFYIALSAAFVNSRYYDLLKR